CIPRHEQSLLEALQQIGVTRIASKGYELDCADRGRYIALHVPDERESHPGLRKSGPDQRLGFDRSKRRRNRASRIDARGSLAIGRQVDNELPHLLLRELAVGRRSVAI